MKGHSDTSLLQDEFSTENYNNTAKLNKNVPREEQAEFLQIYSCILVVYKAVSLTAAHDA